MSGAVILCATLLSVVGCGTLGRETDHLVWAERGQEVGKRLNLFCVQGLPAPARPDARRDARRRRYPAVVTLTCPR